MRFVYKINSSYDGFSPSKILERMRDGLYLELGWRKYIDVVSLRDEVWIVFTGRGFEKGVYVQGLISTIDADTSKVRIRVRNFSQDVPLSDQHTSGSLIEAVNVRNRQVFLWPQGIEIQETCSVSDCLAKKCQSCRIWQTFPLLDKAHYSPPRALRGFPVIPAYWIVPKRCFLYYGSLQPAPWHKIISAKFASLKLGEKSMIYPFAVGINSALAISGVAGFDAIVPIPLSPDKISNGELDRVSELGRELSKINGIPLRRILSLSNPISKRRMVQQGFTASEFKERYNEFLQVDSKVKQFKKIILLDDVITNGTTMSVAANSLRRVNANLEIVVTSAGQMTLKDVVSNLNGPAW